MGGLRAPQFTKQNMSVDHIVINPKGREDPGEKKKRAQSEQDWLDEEKRELVDDKINAARRKPKDEINAIFGRTFYQMNYSAPGWNDQFGDPITVTRFYRYDNQIVDYPASKEEEEKKRKFFGELRVPYAAVPFGEEIPLDDFKGVIEKSRAVLKGNSDG